VEGGKIRLPGEKRKKVSDRERGYEFGVVGGGKREVGEGKGEGHRKEDSLEGVDSILNLVRDVEKKKKKTIMVNNESSAEGNRRKKKGGRSASAKGLPRGAHFLGGGKLSRLAGESSFMLVP